MSQSQAVCKEPLPPSKCPPTVVKLGVLQTDTLHVLAP